MFVKKSLFICAAILFALYGLCGSAVAAAIAPTDKNVDFYGYSEMLKVGDVVDAYDPAGTLCGSFTVDTAGRYGIMHVYGDDLTTPGGKGAKPGDPITFSVNGSRVVPKNPAAAVWTSDGDSIQVDF